MEGPGAVLKPAIKGVQVRSYSDQVVPESTAAVDMRAETIDDGSLHQVNTNPSLKRACSFPPVHQAAPNHQDNSILQAKFARPAFKINLPSVDLSRIAAALDEHRTYRNKAVEALFAQSSGHNSVLDSPVFETQGLVRSEITPLVTPPEEQTEFLFNIPTRKSPAGGDSLNELITEWGGHIRTPGVDAPQGKLEVAESDTGQETPKPELVTPTASDMITSSGETIMSSSQSLQDDGSDGQAGDWLEEVLEKAVSQLANAAAINRTVKVVAQTLPAPIAQNPGSTSATAFPALMTVLQSRIQSSSTPYIQVTHAVPSNFALASLPISPANTPSINPSMDRQEDYFGASVFSSAVGVIDRHDPFSKKENLGSMASSTTLVVPPASTDFALLERYIPPSSVQEFDDLFIPAGPSVLVDRLVELSPNNGTLLFIYPTRAGGATFKSKYLNPILDPVLRTIITSHCLSSSIGANIGSMAALEHILPMEGIKRKLQILLRNLSRGTGPMGKARYTLVHSGKAAVYIERKEWGEWYVKQETPRIRHITTDYINRAVRLPQEEFVSYAMLTREIVEGVTQRAYPEGEGPGGEDGIEVGVFVVRRTRVEDST